MPGVPSIIQMRQRRAAQSRRSPTRPVGLLGAGLFSLVLALGGIWLAWAYSQVTQELPSVEALPALLAPPDGLLLQPTRLYDRSGEHLLLELQNPLAGGRQYLVLPPGSQAGTTPLSVTNSSQQLPAAVVAATLAASDPTFWQHDGYRLQGLTQDEHPTLAQHLVSELLLQDEPVSLRRAVRERLLAAQATARFGRENILEWYLNNANYGRLAYGIDAAARVYFDKPASELDLAEAALLAAVAENPDLNPGDAPQAAIERQKYVLQDLLHYRLADPLAVAQAASEHLSFRPVERPGQALRLEDLQPQVAPAFAHLALQQIQTRIPYAELARGGLNVVTTLDYDLQNQAACAGEAQLNRLQPAASPATPTCEAARLLPTLPSQRNDKVQSIPDLANEVVILDPVTGEILALAGSSPSDQTDLPLLAHPAGTLTTPLVYLAGFTRGLSPASLVWDLPPENGLATQQAPETTPPASSPSALSTPEVQAVQAGGTISPTHLAVPNLDGRFHGPLRLRSALANDYIQPVEAVLKQVGTENVWRTAAQLGIQQTDLPPAGAITSLDLFQPLNLLQASQAYGILANRGVLSGRVLGPDTQASPARLRPIQSGTVLQVVDRAGRMRLDWRAAQTRPILTPALAYLVNNILSDDAARWPSLGHPNPTETGRSVAVKIGRNPAGDSQWIIGYTPQRLIGVWLGSESSEKYHDPVLPVLPAPAEEQMRLAAAGLWHALTQYANQGQAAQKWDQPEGISLIKVCDPSGMLPTRDCPNVVEEVFLAGSEPIQVDRMYRSAFVDRESQRLATVFTPQDQIEEQPYFVVPAEAAGWAATTGYETPPEVYDTVPLEVPAVPGVQISSPAMFAVLHGTVTISGTAAASTQATSNPPTSLAGTAASASPTVPAETPKLAYYRVQVGQGLYPKQWLLVGEDKTEPQPGGPLTSWDTRGLSGLYAVQLIVVHQDQSVARSTILVTIDNQPPRVKILSPAPNQDILASQRKRLVLLADISDDLELGPVRFYLDDQLLATFIQSPYAISWPSQTGQHTLRVEAVDQAGNTSQSSLTFEVK